MSKWRRLIAFASLAGPLLFPGVLQGCLMCMRNNPPQVLPSKSFLEMYLPQIIWGHQRSAVVLLRSCKTSLILCHSAGCTGHLGFFHKCTPVPAVCCYCVPRLQWGEHPSAQPCMVLDRSIESRKEKMKPRARLAYTSSFKGPKRLPEMDFTFCFRPANDVIHTCQFGQCCPPLPRTRSLKILAWWKSGFWVLSVRALRMWEKHG